MTKQPDIHTLLATYRAKQPFNPTNTRLLYRACRYQFIHESNALEGNTFTLEEVKTLCDFDKVIPGKSFREHIEVANQLAALNLLDAAVAESQSLTPGLLKTLNQTLLARTAFNEEGGHYRLVPVVIHGTDFVPIAPEKIESKITSLIKHYRDQCVGLDQVEFIRLNARLHAELVSIHPFMDGNGRTARLVSHFECRKAGLGGLIIPASERETYCRALDASHQGNFEPIENLFISCFAQMLKKHLDGHCPEWRRDFEEP